jgi:hypothetical protein
MNADLADWQRGIEEAVFQRENGLTVNGGSTEPLPEGPSSLDILEKFTLGNSRPAAGA